MTRAAVMISGDKPIQVCDDVVVEDPHANEVRVRVAASGVCHSDLLMYEEGGGAFPLPLVLGHEAAGILEAVGEGVSDLHVGDHVILMPMPQCGRCFYCTHGTPTLCDMVVEVRSGMLFDRKPHLFLDKAPLYQLSGCGSFCEEIIVPATSAVKISRDMPLAQAALIGCGVATGFGAAMHVAEIVGGETVAVLGCGGVGLNGIQGARMAGAGRIIAVDLTESKLTLAAKFGATHLVNATDSDPVEQVKAMTEGRGVEIAFEMIGSVSTKKQAMAMTRPGGTCVFTGAGFEPTEFTHADLVSSGRTFKGNLLGMRAMRTLFPQLVELYQEGDLMLDELISRKISLDDVNEAFASMTRSEVARSVIVND